MFGIFLSHDQICDTMRYEMILKEINQLLQPRIFYGNEEEEDREKITNLINELKKIDSKYELNYNCCKIM